MSAVTITQTTVQQFPGTSVYRRIFRLSTDRLVAIVLRGTYSPTGLCYQTSDDQGVTWSTATQIDSIASGYQYTCYLDTDNNIYIVYVNASSYTVFRKLTYSAGTWTIGSVVTVVTSSGAYYNIKKADNGTLYIVFNLSNIVTYYSINDGVSWTATNPPSTNATSIDSLTIGNDL